MATIVSFHAHPDDECISTGGTLAKAADDGHRVVLVFATQGENGEVADGFLDDGEELWERRIGEARRAAEILGVRRVEFLGYRDSGMMGTPENDDPGAFWQADVDQAAERLAAILREEAADVLIAYDDHGMYGHPDHIQVNRVGMRAAGIANVPRVYQATANRDHIQRGLAAAREAGMDLADDLPREMPDFGSADDAITTGVDVTDVLDRKRAAMQAHPSQIAPDSFFLSFPPELFRQAFGMEWFIRTDRRPTRRESSIVEGLAPSNAEPGR
jgi:LmbE family N-acetylglucosaminyl deacetylase